MSQEDQHKGGDHPGHAEMLRQWRWRDYTNIALGVWLISSPSTLGYQSTGMVWSDLITGAVIVVLGIMTLWPRYDLARWGLCFAGLWLLFAPLVFWAPDAAAYANNTLVGAAVISFSVLLPMMPSHAHHEVMTGPGPDNPPGWSYNPSDWIQRLPIVAMALVGFFLSRYLAAYQLGHIDEVWDPFFGDGTRRVLESEVSRAFPISDAGLGAAAYLIEALSGLMGARDRWRTMPWMVTMFGVLVVPLGIVSLVLVMLQPISVGAWCTICLITAAAMLIMIAPAVDEVVAMSQFLIGARREGKPFWRIFWRGGTLDAYPESDAEEPAESGHAEKRSLVARIVAAVDLNNVPWNMIVCAALGVWLMAAPAVLGVEGRAADMNHLAGALVVTWAVIAFGEIIRPIRLLNVLMGIAIAVAPWVLSGATDASRINDMAVGLALIVFSLPRGRINERFGSWNRHVTW